MVFTYINYIIVLNSLYVITDYPVIYEYKVQVHPVTSVLHLFNVFDIF